jgi:hypothetical protein
MSRRNFVLSAFASVSEKVVSSTRASGFARTRKTARCSATMVFPQCQAQLLDLVPKAIGVYEKALSSDDLALATATATKLLEGMHVLSKGGIEETIAIANKASPEAEGKERSLRIIAQVIYSDFINAEKFGHPIHPKLEHVKKELDRRMEEEREGSAI